MADNTATAPGKPPVLTDDLLDALRREGLCSRCQGATDDEGFCPSCGTVTLPRPRPLVR